MSAKKTFEETCAELGINRGQLAVGFHDGGSIAQFHQSQLINRRARKRDFKRPVAEDLTKLNPKITPVSQAAAVLYWKNRRRSKNHKPSRQ